MFVQCEICKNNYKRITNYHLRKHSIDMMEYSRLFPKSPTMTEETRLNYSKGTKKYSETMTKEEKQERYSKRVYTEEQKLKHIKILEEGRKNMNYKSPERSKRISEACKKRWEGISKEDRSKFIKEMVVPKYKQKLGEEEYNKMMRKKGQNGCKKLIEMGKKKEMNNFEKEMYDLLVKKGYSCEWQFEVDGWFYDVYIKEKNIIVEFDGDYWHPISIDELSDDRAKRQYNIDRIKDKVAENNGYTIIRIRQSEKHKIDAV